MRAYALCFALLAQASQADTALTKQQANQREPTVEEIWRELDTQKSLAEYECTTKLDAEDPTVEWKKIGTERKDDKWVVSRYGTRNMGMVTGVCHVTMTGRKVKAIRTWLK